MDSRDERPYWSSDGQPRLQRYIVQATKAVLCVSGWFSIFAVLLTYGPPAMSMTSEAPYTASIVGGLFAVLLSAGAATVLIIILSVFGLSAIGWNRNRSAETEDETETIEDETHA